MGLCNYCQNLPVELFDSSGAKACKVTHHSSYHCLEASAVDGRKLREVPLDAIRRELWGDVSSLTKESQKEAFTLRSDTAGQYLEIGSWVVGIIDGRKVPDGWGTFQLSISLLPFNIRRNLR
jgi:hypothetical protein